MLVVTVFGNETGNPDDNASTVKELYQESYDDSRYGLQFEVLGLRPPSHEREKQYHDGCDMEGHGKQHQTQRELPAFPFVQHERKHAQSHCDVLTGDVQGREKRTHPENHQAGEAPPPFFNVLVNE
jgi:hypothetical protein